MKTNKLSLALGTLSLCLLTGQIWAQSPSQPFDANNPPPKPPEGAGQKAQQKISLTEGDWSFDLIGSGSNKTASITYYSGKQSAIVVVPAILGGAPVTAIASQAFGHHSEILAVYLPSSVTQVNSWAFYDLNAAQLISFANPNVKIASDALQSTANAQLYVADSANSDDFKAFKITKVANSPLGAELKNPQAAAIAPGTYLNITSDKHLSLTLAQLLSIARSASGVVSDVVQQANVLSFTGSAYQAQRQQIKIAKNLSSMVQAADLVHQFQSYNSVSAAAFNQQLRQNNAYADAYEFLQVESGAYLDGSPVELDKKLTAYDVETGQKIILDKQNSGLPSTGQGKYKYVAWRDQDQNGKIDQLYYSPFALSYQYNEVTLSSEQQDLDGLKARDRLNPQYLAFANAVIAASGATQQIHQTQLTLHTAKHGSPIEASANKNRSILWANDYAQIKVDNMRAQSNAIGDWARMSLVSGLSVPNTEIIMEWGMNALLYATNGGQIEVGDLNGETSQFYANGDGANGVIAGAAGLKDATVSQPFSTSSVLVKNANFQLEGWNSHVADTVYGGYAKLQKVTATTGKLGSYAVGQSSALANDFGNGVVEAEQFHTTVYGNRSAGAYVIGGGVIRAVESSFVSKMDAGLVIASGGKFHIEHSIVEGQIAVRNRGGIVSDSSSAFNQVTLSSKRDLTHYVSGQAAQQAVSAWRAATGSNALAGALISRDGYNFAHLAAHYQLSDAQTKSLLDTLSGIANVPYVSTTLLRNSLLDNTFYNYSAGQYLGSTDFSEVPYLTVGSTFGGLTAAILEFENAGTLLNLDQVKVRYAVSQPYQYLLASEAGSDAKVSIKNSQLHGLIWNEGDVNRVVEGQPGQRSSSFAVSFDNSQFSGSFADASQGLWSVAAHPYRNAVGEQTDLNGNYYAATANWKGQASFDNHSIWYINHDSYLGELKLSKDSQIIAPKGYKLRLLVDGKAKRLAAGTYRGKIAILLDKQ